MFCQSRRDRIQLPVGVEIILNVSNILYATLRGIFSNLEMLTLCRIESVDSSVRMFIKFWKIQDNFDPDGQLDSIAPLAPIESNCPSGSKSSRIFHEHRNGTVHTLDGTQYTGSHDSFTYSLDPKSPVSKSEGGWIRSLSHLPFIKGVVYRWSVTQNLSAAAQLKAGVRYVFDILRFSNYSNSKFNRFYTWECGQFRSCLHENFEKFVMISTPTGDSIAPKRDRIQLPVGVEIISNFSKFSCRQERNFPHSQWVQV